MKNYWRVLFIVVVALIAVRCFQGNPVGTPVGVNNSTQAASVYSALAMYSDNFGVALLSSKDKSAVAALGDFLSNAVVPRAEAAACPNPLFGSSACAGSTVTVATGGCIPSLNATASWTGSALFSFDSNASCTAAVPAGITSLPAGGSVTMTSAGGLTRTISGGGGYVEMDSQPSGYLNTASGGETMMAGNGSLPCVSGRCVTVNGFHRAVYSSAAVLQYDHTITTNTIVTMTGTGSSLIINGGALYMQDNINKVLMNVVISGPLVFNGTCCFPIQGQITTLYSGASRTYTELTQFGPTCGQASVNSTPTILTNCL